MSYALIRFNLAFVRHTPASLAIAFLLLITLMAAKGCTPEGNPGRIVNEVGDPAQFVHEDGMVYVTRDGIRGLDEVSFDGTHGGVVAITEFSFADHSRAANLWALLDRSFRLHLLDAPGAAPMPVSDLDVDIGHVAFSPDGRRLAASFRSPHGGATSDAIAMVDLEEPMAVTIFEAEHEDYVISLLQWSLEGDTIVYTALAHGQVELDPATGQRTEADPELEVAVAPRSRWTPIDCPHSGAWLRLEGTHDFRGLVLKEGRQTRRLVEVVDFHYGGDHDARMFDRYLFSPSCDYVVFVFDGQVWIVDVDTAVVGVLGDGEDIFLLR